MSRRLNARLLALETTLGVGVTPADLEAETAAYGHLVWGDATGVRCYALDTGDGFELRILGHDRPALLYQVDGIDWRHLQ